MTIHRNRIVALGVAGALAIGLAVSTGPALAAPVPSNTAALTQADVNNVVNVQGRRWRRDPGPWVAGAALGIIGGVIASEAYRDRYYDNGYAYRPYQNSYYNGYADGQYPYATPYPAQRYYGGYAPYGNCTDRPEAC